MVVEPAFVSEDRFTREEFHAWIRELPASDRHRYELLSGRIAMTPPAGWPHSVVTARIVAALMVHVDARRLGTVQESSAGYDLPSGDCVQPDVSYFSRDTLRRGPAPRVGGSVEFSPDLVVEVLSLSTRKRDLGEKREIYERNQVAEYWVVDPVAGTVTVFAREATTGGMGFDEPTTRDRGRIPSRLFPDLDLPIERLFD